MSPAKNPPGLMSILGHWTVIISVGSLVATGAIAGYQIGVLTDEVAAMREEIKALPVKISSLESDQDRGERERAAMLQILQDHEQRLRLLERRRGI